MRVLSGLVLGPLSLVVGWLGGWPFIVAIALAAWISFYEWFGMARRGGRFVIDAMIGVIYLPVCLLSIIVLREGIVLQGGGYLVVTLLVAVSASDTGAYFCGKLIGGPKMAPKLSPNKTWAGLGGAMFFSGLALLISVLVAPYLHLSVYGDIHLRPLWAFGLGLFLGAVGQAGDVFISALKRRAGLKDSGHLIPGHGGLLDRIDALLLVAPVFTLVLFLLTASDQS